MIFSAKVVEKTYIRSSFHTFFLILHFDCKKSVMKKILYSQFDKAKIAEMPVVSFPGRIVVIQSVGEAERAVSYLLSQPILGVDTETRPSFRRGESHKVSLLQVSSKEICFLFRLNMIGITPAIKQLLENTEVPMIGISWHDDILSLKRRAAFVPGRFIDLQNVVGDIGIKDMSLQKIYANIFHKKISKRQRLTNWDADVLNDKQKQYAAIDAWSCIQLYEEIERLKQNNEFELVVVHIPEPLVMQTETKLTNESNAI